MNIDSQFLVAFMSKNDKQNRKKNEGMAESCSSRGVKAKERHKKTDQLAKARHFKTFKAQT